MAAGLGVIVVLVAGLAWPGVEDPVQSCPAAVVLNGDHPARADEAAALYRDGVTQEVWLTSDPRSSAGGQDSGTASNVRVLVSRGVPERAIHLVDGAATSTKAELGLVRAEAARRNVSCLIVVTSAAHATRVRVVWWRLGGSSPRIVVRHARDAAYAGWRVRTTEIGKTLGAVVGIGR